MEECISVPYVTFPWLTKNIMQLIRKRNALFQKAKRSKETSHFALYKKIRNRVVNFICSGRRQYFNSLASADNKGNLLNKTRESIQHYNKVIV